MTKTRQTSGKQSCTTHAREKHNYRIIRELNNKHVYDGVEQEECRGLPRRLVICCTSVVPDKCLRVFVFAFQSLVDVEGIDQDESNNFVLLKASTAAACKRAQSSLCRHQHFAAVVFALFGAVGAS